MELLTCPSSDIGGVAPNPKIPIKPTDASIASLPLWPNSLAPTAPAVMQFAQETFLPSTDGRMPARLCLVQYADHAELLHLPTYKKKKTARIILKLAHIKPKRGEQILACGISSCGRFIAYSDSTRSRVLKISFPVSIYLLFLDLKYSAINLGLRFFYLTRKRGHLIRKHRES